MKEINSLVFGKILLLDEKDDDYIKLKELITKYPVDAFGIVNKSMNEVGYCCKVDKIPEGITL